MGGELGGEVERGQRQERQRKQKRLIYSNVMQLKLHTAIRERKV